MQEAIPYKSWIPHYTTTNLLHAPPQTATASTNMAELVSENAIVVVARRGCCMTHVIKRLLLCLGVNPPVFEVDGDDEGKVLKELQAAAGEETVAVVQLPAVFVGGKFLGGLDKVVATHITGELVPILKQAGALWL
ncbi:GRXC9 [Linum grandiflorum]